MRFPTPNLAIFQIFGANTNVGKTIISSGICRAAPEFFSKVLYLKPIQTGYPQDSDSRYQKRVLLLDKELDC